jgi:hypothetical protein
LAAAGIAATAAAIFSKLLPSPQSSKMPCAGANISAVQGTHVKSQQGKRGVYARVVCMLATGPVLLKYVHYAHLL